LKVFLRDEDLVPDPEDFLKFLKNYETVQKRAGGRKHNLASAGKKESQKSKSYFFFLKDQQNFLSISVAYCQESLVLKNYEGNTLLCYKSVIISNCN
jgi:hypothetical protein